MVTEVVRERMSLSHVPSIAGRSKVCKRKHNFRRDRERKREERPRPCRGRVRVEQNGPPLG